MRLFLHDRGSRCYFLYIIFFVPMLLITGCDSDIGVSTGQSASESIDFGANLGLLSGDTIHIECQVNQPCPEGARTYEIINRGTLPAEIAVESSEPYLAIAIDQPVIPAGGVGTFTVSMIPDVVSTLGVGDYPANILISQVGVANSAALLELILHIIDNSADGSANNSVDGGPLPPSGPTGDPLGFPICEIPACPGGRPGPDNTGPIPGIPLSPPPASMNIPPGSGWGMRITEDGATYENLEVTGDILIQADNVTIRNFRINAGGAIYGVKAVFGHQNLLLEDGEITNFFSAGIVGGNLVARRLNINESGNDGVKLGSNSRLEASWVHRLGTHTFPNGNPAHADANQSIDKDNVEMVCNYMDNPVPTGAMIDDPDTAFDESTLNVDNPAALGEPYRSNNMGLFQVESLDEDDGSENLTVDSNWLNGGNYTTSFMDSITGGAGPPTNVRFTNNCIGNHYRYGVLRLFPKSTCIGCAHTTDIVIEGNTGPNGEPLAHPNDLPNWIELGYY